MAGIVQLEVYTDRGQGWKLVQRFPNDQSAEAFNLAKELESRSLPVKIIREIYNPQANTSEETVDYVSKMAADRERARRNGGKGYKTGAGGALAGLSKRSSRVNIDMQVVVEVVKFILIVMLSLVSSNILLMLVGPLIETLLPVDAHQLAKFLFFFAAFLLLTVPLLLKKVSWEVFGGAKRGKRPAIADKKVMSQAESLLARYRLGDEYDPSIAPAWPEAPFEYRQQIVNFLSQAVSSLDKNAISDGFRKLGVKLVVFGGVLELARHEGLSLPQANSLLFEAFGVIDGDNADVEEFYEAKKAFGDNKIAIYLAGVGSFMMASVLRGKSVDSGMLQRAFAKWEDENKAGRQRSEESGRQDRFACVLAFGHDVRLEDPTLPAGADKIDAIRGRLKALMDSLSAAAGLSKLEDGVALTVFRSARLGAAIGFALDFLDKFGEYLSEVNDENVSISVKFALLPKSGDDGLSPMLEDMLGYANGGEILADEAIKARNANATYAFDSLGAKALPKSGKTLELYSIIR